MTSISRYRRALLTVALVGAAFVGCTCQGSSPPGGPSAGGGKSVFPALADPDQAAEAALPAFLALVRPGRAAELGFEPSDDLRTVKAGAPYDVFRLSLQELLTRGPGPVETVLEDLHEKTYSLMVRGTPRSSLTVQETKGLHQAVAFGGGNRVRLYAIARKSLVGAGASPAGPFRAVYLPELDSFMIGARINGELVLTTVQPEPLLGLGVGASRSIGQFAALVKELFGKDKLDFSGPPQP